MACISKSKRKQKMDIEAQRAKHEKRPLSEYERDRADAVLFRDGFPDVYIDDDVRLEVLKRLGLRK
jgi:hypothetical protein